MLSLISGTIRTARLFLCLLLPLSFFGCVSQQSDTSQKVVIWHWVADREDVFNSLAQEYQKQTGVKVVFQLYAPSDVYSQKVMAAAQVQALPDIYGILGEKKVFGSFIKAGHVLDLTPYLEQDNGSWKREFFAKALVINEFSKDNPYGVPAGTYGIPVDVMNIQMVYNKSLFKKAGLNPNNPPATWQDFIALCKRFKKEFGVEGFACGWGETWLIDCFASNYAFNIMGEDKVIATIKGDVPYTDPQWIQVFDLFKQLTDEKILAVGMLTMGNKESERAFANEKVVFSFNGSWCVNVYRGMNPSLQYGVFLPPKASSAYPMRIWGGAGTSFMVNARSKNKEQAVAFLKWFTAKEQQIRLSQETVNLPANKESVSAIDPMLSEFAKGMNNVTHPNIWPIQEYSEVIEAFVKGIQSIIIGEKTPQQVAQEVQKIKVLKMKEPR